MTSVRSVPRLLVFLLVPIMASAAAAGGKHPVRPPSRPASKPSVSQSQPSHPEEAAAQSEQALAAQCEAQIRTAQATLKQYMMTWRQLDAEQKVLAQRYRGVWMTLTTAEKQGVVARWNSLEQQKRDVKARGDGQILVMKQLQANCARSFQNLQASR
jgi:hypothetical protein